MELKPDTRDYPFYIKAPAILLGLVLFVYILSALGDVLVPFAFSVLIAILLNPMYNWLAARMSKVPSILLTILIAVLIVVALFYFLSTQISVFSESIPLIKQKAASLLVQLQDWAKAHFGISIQKQVDAFVNGLNSSSNFITNTLGTIFGTISVVVLIPIYIFIL